VRRSPEATDTYDLSFEILDSLDVWGCNQKMIGAFHDRHDNADRKTGESGPDKILKGPSIIDIPTEDSVHHYLVLHDHYDGIESFTAKQSFFFGDNERQGKTADSACESESRPFCFGPEARRGGREKNNKEKPIKGGGSHGYPLGRA
jgi:hypothetical protein